VRVFRKDIIQGLAIRKVLVVEMASIFGWVLFGML